MQDSYAIQHEAEVAPHHPSAQLRRPPRRGQHRHPRARLRLAPDAPNRHRRARGRRGAPRARARPLVLCAHSRRAGRLPPADPGRGVGPSTAVGASKDARPGPGHRGHARAPGQRAAPDLGRRARGAACPLGLPLLTRAGRAHDLGQLRGALPVARPPLPPGRVRRGHVGAVARGARPRRRQRSDHLCACGRRRRGDPSGRVPRAPASGSSGSRAARLLSLVHALRQPGGAASAGRAAARGRRRRRHARRSRCRGSLRLQSDCHAGHHAGESVLQPRLRGQRERRRRLRRR